MSISQVKSGLDEIAATIAGAERSRVRAETFLADAKSNLDAITTQHAAVIAEIDGYTPTGAHETLAKDEKAKLAVEFTALKAKLATDLSNMADNS